MITKIIHYCWFGSNPIPEKHAQYIAKWKEVLPDYKIKLWNELNSPMDIPYMQQALKDKKWANLSNYTRLHAIYQDGGIYLDTDIEVLKSFDSFLNNECFLGFEDIHIDWDGCVNNAVIGAEPGHPFIKEMKEKLLVCFDGTEQAHFSSPNFTTSLLKEKGLTHYGEQTICNVHIYPIEFFYPYSWHERFTQECVKENTVCIHHYERSWDTQAPKKQGPLAHYLYHIQYRLKKMWSR